jgi:hypothetical protein
MPISGGEGLLQLQTITTQPGRLNFGGSSHMEQSNYV